MVMFFVYKETCRGDLPDPLFCSLIPNPCPLSASISLGLSMKSSPASAPCCVISLPARPTTQTFPADPAPDVPMRSKRPGSSARVTGTPHWTPGSPPLSSRTTGAVVTWTQPLRSDHRLRRPATLPSRRGPIGYISDGADNQVKCFDRRSRSECPPSPPAPAPASCS